MGALPSRVTGLESQAALAGTPARRRTSAILLGIALLGFFVVAALSYRATTDLLAPMDDLAEAGASRAAIVHLLSALQDVETGARGFALTGRDEFLEPFERGVGDVSRWHDDLVARTKNDGAQRERVGALAALVPQRIALARKLVASRRQGAEAAAAEVATGEGKAIMDQVRTVLADMDARATSQVADRTAAVQASQRRALGAIGALIALSSLLVVAVFAVLRRETARVHRAQSSLRTFLDATPDASLIVDATGRIVFANVQAERLFGWSRTELVGQQVEMLVPDAARAGHAALRDRYAVDPRPRPMGAGLELNARNRDGGEVPVEISLSPIATPDGRLVIAAVRDITERRRAAEQVRAARVYAESLVETVRQPLLVIDQGLRVRRANRAFYELYQTRPGETVGQPLLAIDGGRWNVPGLQALLAGILPGTTMLDDFELVHEVPALGLRTLLLSGRKVERATQGDDLILVAIEDVTERKRSEQLLVERRALERVNADLQEFAYVASHDLQEPLRKLRTFGDRVARKYGGALPEEGRDYLARMQNAAQRMQALIEDLLAFSRVSTRAQPFEQVDLAAVAQEVVADLEGRLEETGGRIEVGRLPTIDADPLQMRQLLQNLLSNGLKFHHPSRAPTVRLTGVVRNGAGKPPECELRVEDDGIGFDEKYVDRIFTIFQRLHGRGEYEGTGLGLAICRKIVERHHGRIGARSRPGEGATFVVSLPVSQGGGRT